MPSRSRLFSKVATDVDASGNLRAEAISSDVSFGPVVYESTDNLPYVGNSTGDQAYVKDNNRFYIWDSAGWYNVALINRAPAISSVQDSDGNTTPFVLSTEGAVTTITITAADSDGDPITYSATADSDFNGLATLSQDGNEFTIAPFSQDSASTTSGTITFKATDGINIASSGIQTFTLSFVSAFWSDVVLSIGTSSTNGLDNDTFIDRSTNAHTVTPSGSPVQTAFHPYLENWSFTGNGTDNYLVVDNTSGDLSLGTLDFTIEAWINFTSMPAGNGYPSSAWLIGGGPLNSNTGFDIAFGSTNLQVGLTDFASLHINTAHNLTINQWYHFALVRSGTSLTAYINGIQLATTTTSDSADTLSTGLAISAAEPSGSTDGNFPGYISNLRILKGTALYTSSFTVPSQKLAAITNTVLLTCQSNRFIDNSLSPKTITVNGSSEISAFNPFGQESEYAVGENKGSGYFDGSDALDTETTLKNLGTSDFTIEMFLYPEDINNICVIDTRNESNSGWMIFLETAGVSFYVNGSRVVQSAIGTNQWVNVVITRESGTVKLFINGVSVDTASYSSSLDGGDDFRIGAKSYSLSSTLPYEGFISDLKLTKSTALYTTNFTPPTAPVGNTNASLYLPMDNAGIYDKTGNHTLTLVGNTSTSTTQTKFADTAMYFDGSGDYLELPSASEFDFGSGDFTIEAWIYATSSLTTNNRTIIDARPASGGYSNNYLLFVSTSAKLTFAFADDTVGSEDFATTSTLSPNNWIHVAVARSGDTIRVFVNGSVENTSNVSGKSFNSSLFHVGYRAFSTSSLTYWDGYLENFQILKGVAKYTANFTVPSQEQGRTYQAED